MKYYLFIPDDTGYELRECVTKESMDWFLKTKCGDKNCIALRKTEDAYKLSLTKLAVLYNEVASEPVKKFTDKATAVRRLLKVLGGAPGRITDDMVIHRMVKSNYRRKNSKSYKSFTLLKEGMTVKEFYNAGGIREDLLWDIRNKKVVVI